MKILNRVKDMNALLMAGGNYSVAYEYDAKQRISKETVTGDIAKTTTFAYDDATDNITTETIVQGGKTITKTYTYDPVTNNITGISVTQV